MWLAWGRWRLQLGCVLIGFGVNTPSASFKLDRVILSTDNKPEYIQFWPIVARAWQELVGLRPTLVLVADESVQVDTSLGDVIRFQPVPEVPTGLQAQVLRLFLPVLFPA
ncbi:MAG TPA: hypothetical protein VJJ83_02325, partial [Candidatus Babeliales bacterium]|nr:hypothetical protein [Candidatus Babeliales bacterium]